MICLYDFPSSSSAVESSRTKLVEGGFMGKERKICFTSIDVTLSVSYVARNSWIKLLISYVMYLLLYLEAPYGFLHNRVS